MPKPSLLIKGKVKLKDAMGFEAGTSAPLALMTALFPPLANSAIKDK